MIEVKHLKKSFSDTEVLKNISFKVEKGDVICVLGPSGSGKTTMLRCMNFLETASDGSMIFDGQPIDFKTISKKEILKIRQKTSFVFQNYNLFKNKTALENVIEGLVIARKMNKEEAIKIGMSALEKVGMLDKKDNYPSSLSGGQQQRVAIARAIATRPQIIYFDEPTSALDPSLTQEVLNVIVQLAKEGRTMIVVTHEMAFAKNVANKIIFMKDGYIKEEASSNDFFNHPRTQEASLFINAKEKGEN